jgi:metal-responsive CopG/Arc/MetJ family transcriptional regulator
MDEELLERIDADAEVKLRGRSAFLRAAASFYLAAKKRRETDRAILDAYDQQADEMIGEVAEFMDLQEWPGS